MTHLTTTAPRRRQEELGQFLTAPPVADFMASMFGPLPSAPSSIERIRSARACHALRNAARGGRRICPGGTKEISRWSSEARANTTGSHPQNERTPEGVPEAAEELPAHPPGRMAVVPMIRWYSLAKLARPPANFFGPSRGRSHVRTKANPIGVAACALPSKLPGELKGKLPTAKQLADIVRAEMEKEVIT